MSGHAKHLSSRPMRPRLVNSNVMTFLSKNTKKLSFRRNDIVHANVVALNKISLEFLRLSADSPFEPNPTYFLVPPYYAGRKFDPQNLPKYQFGSMEIRMYEQAFLATLSLIDAIYFSLRARHQSSP